MKHFKAWMRRDDVQHIVSISGGKDSTATYLIAQEFGRPFRAVFADTGNEHELTLEYVARLSERTGGPKVETVRADFTADFARKRIYIAEKWPDKGVPADVVARALNVFHPTGNPFLDLCMMKGRFPSRKAQFCTEELKSYPITDQIILPALRGGQVLQWHGVRADESEPRSRLPKVERDETGAVIWRPIYHHTVERVFWRHARHGISPNPLYTLGMGRVGCMPCINCAKDELREIALRFPQHIDRISEWEHIVASVSKRGAATFFPIASMDPTASKHDNITAATHGIRRAVEWSRTTRGGRLYDLFSMASAEAATCSSKYGLCE